jgi:hypothetical protein
MQVPIDSHASTGVGLRMALCSWIEGPGHCQCLPFKVAQEYTDAGSDQRCYTHNLCVSLRYTFLHTTLNHQHLQAHQKRTHIYLQQLKTRSTLPDSESRKDPSHL